MTKQDLRDFREEMRRRKNIEERRREIRARMDGLMAQSFTGTPGGGLAKPDDRWTACLADLEKLDRQYAAILAKTTGKELKIEKAMIAAKLTANEAEVVRCYYFDCRKWEAVAAAMNYSEQHVRRIHGWAVWKLRKAEIKR